jgi:hypothetical protein
MYRKSAEHVAVSKLNKPAAISALKSGVLIARSFRPVKRANGVSVGLRPREGGDAGGRASPSRLD